MKLVNDNTNDLGGCEKCMKQETVFFIFERNFDKNEEGLKIQSVI